MIFRVLIPLLVLVGCGSSPIFNHSNEPDPESQLGKLKPCELTFSSGCWGVTWTMSPTTTGESQFLLSPPLGFDGKVDVELWMPEHGHGSSPVVVEPQSNGQILVRDVWFIMPGLWEVRVKWHLLSGAEENQKFEVRL